jgi:hypothetical protein
MSTADLALWFDLPYGTVRSYRKGTIPIDARLPQILDRLTWLERAIRVDLRLPIPLSVRAHERKEYLLGVRASGRRKR